MSINQPSKESTMRVVNGFSIIAHRPVQVGSPNEGFVIIGARECPGALTGYEYVTSVMRSLDQSHWDGNGHYYHYLLNATKDYLER